MPEPRTEKEVVKKPECLHEWLTFQNNLSEQRCKRCVAIRISEQEWDRRQQVWTKYYSVDVVNSPAYITFQSLRPYMRFIGKEMPEEEKKEMQEILKGMDEHYAAEGYLKKPSFPDPERFGYNIA